VDIDWCKEQLTSYVNMFHGNDEDQDYNWLHPDDLNRKLPVVKRILDAIREPTVLVGDYNSYDTYRQIKDAAYRGLGILDVWGEIEERLRPDTPQLAANLLHPWVWGPAQSLWDTAHYREAVQAAAVGVNANLQSLSGRRDLSDYKLVTELLTDKDPEPDKPRLRWPGRAGDEEVRSMQSGLRYFGSGCFQTIRNRSTHDLAEIPEAAALEQLASLSTFCRWVERCELHTADS
jgi:hypothetical protein